MIATFLFRFRSFTSELPASRSSSLRCAWARTNRKHGSSKFCFVADFRIMKPLTHSDIMFKLFKYCSSHSPSLALHHCLCFACILDNRSLASMKTTHSAEYFLGTRRQLLWQGCALAPSCNQGLNPRLKAPNAPMAVQRSCLVTILFFTQVFAQC